MPNILTAAQLFSLLDDEVKLWSHEQDATCALGGFRKKLEAVYLTGNPDTVEGATTRLAEAMLGRSLTNLHLMVIDDAAKTQIQDYVTDWTNGDSSYEQTQALVNLLTKLIAQ